jgi:hypothetical protein
LQKLEQGQTQFRCPQLGAALQFLKRIPAHPLHDAEHFHAVPFNNLFIDCHNLHFYLTTQVSQVLELAFSEQVNK